MSDRELKLSIVFEAVDKAINKMTGVKTTAKSVGHELQTARKELKELNAAQSNITSFVKLERKLADNSAKLKDARDKVKALKTEIDQAAKPTREMERELARASKSADNLSGAVRDDAQNLERLRDKLKAAKVATGDLAKAQSDLRGKIGETTHNVQQQKDAYANIMARQGKSSGKAGPGSFTDKAVKAGIIVSTAKEALELASAPVIADAEAQQQLTQIGLKANLSREQLAQMREEIQRLAPRVRKTTEELRGGVDFLAASGVDPKAAMKMMEPIAKASHAYKAEISELAQGANAALTNLKIPLGKDDIDRTRQTARMLEIMAVGANEGNFEIADMARNFPTLTARLNALDQRGTPAVANLASALEVAFKATGDADQAANNIDNLLLKINAKDTIQNFKKFGIDLPRELKKAYHDGKGPLEAIADLTQKATGGNLDKLSYLFGDQQAQTGVLSLIQNMKEMQRIRDKMLNKDSVGLIDRNFATVTNDTTSRWDKLMARWSVFKESGGEMMRGATNWLLGTLDSVFTPFSEMAQTKSREVAAAASSGLMQALSQQRGNLSLMQWWFTAKDTTTAQQRALLIGHQAGDGFAMAFKQRANSPTLMQWMSNPQVMARTQQQSILIGNHVGDGVALGIEQKTDRVKRAADNLALAAQNQVRRKLDIHSPSRVFMQIGGHISSGLAEGIERTSGRPVRSVSRLVAAISAMSAGLSPAIANVGPRPNTAPAIRPAVRVASPIPTAAGPVTIHVHAGPGMDVKDLARQVRRELEAAQGVSTRSRYDTDGR
ncbi:MULTISPECIES: phage tail tape measure protein [unclassified Novosphingobium]|uniref:phage tail tape measure protein n=1 Tax=unclassified Novosphingobium TaxID=2644732 RepID=UPI000D31D419|nr:MULTISPECIES: phage tail tape measure protein [unclassified Novosphingobium]PTR05483.1 TP901 family phage tail tape measure protein [Novosphingobium sp. GV055]PUA94041.1 TP901 family phage tail tape measure protein [Novosphingobium sp. GV061]PUB11628.1 TP901 family phage tail tape measure protein [Novosphingobium sp. GV079]PUB37102.1 TP901 family phage tail tape measure protein [Novosphingobium sp. GV027]